MRGLRRVGIPLVTLMVVACGIFTKAWFSHVLEKRNLNASVDTLLTSAWSWSQHHPIVAAVALLASILAVIAGAYGIDEWQCTRQLSRSSLYFGRGASLRFTRINRGRRTEYRYIQLARALERPHDIARRSTTEMLAPDACAYFEQCLRSDSWHRRHDGFLIAGRPLSGKTRLVVEFLRATYPKSYVIVLDPTAQIEKLELPRLVKRAPVINIVLDDLERFESSQTTILRWTNESRAHKQSGGRVLIWGTVKSGGEAQAVADRAAFSELRRMLDCGVLAPLTNSDMDCVAREVGVPLSREQWPERTFSWLEAEAFLQMGERWYKLSRSAQGALATAAQLNECGIVISSTRWRSVHRSLESRVSDSEFSEALTELRLNGFMLDSAPDPAYLESVVPYDWTPEAQQVSLAQALVSLQDAEGLCQWGTHLAVTHGDPQRCVKLLHEATLAALRGSTATSLDIAARASFNLGIVFRDLRWQRLGMDAFTGAITYGLDSGSREGLAAAAKASDSLCVELMAQQRLDNAIAASKAAVEYGVGSGLPGGLEAAAKASVNLGIGYFKQQQHKASVEAYLAAIELGERCGSADGLLACAKASECLGCAYSRQQRSEEAITAFRSAILYAERSGSPQGQMRVAKVNIHLGNQYAQEGHQTSAVAQYQAAVEAGQLSRLPEGWVAASGASVLLAMDHECHHQFAEAADVYREAILFALKARTAEGLVAASKASIRLALAYSRRRRSGDAVDAYRGAIRYGQEAGTSEGYAKAATASLYLGRHLADADLKEEAGRAYATAVRLGERCGLDEGQLAAMKASSMLESAGAPKASLEPAQGHGSAARSPPAPARPGLSETPSPKPHVVTSSQLQNNGTQRKGRTDTSVISLRALNDRDPSLIRENLLKSSPGTKVQRD